MAKSKVLDSFLFISLFFITVCFPDSGKEGSLIHIQMYHLMNLQGPPLSNARNASSAISGKRKKGAKNNKGREGFCFIGDSLVMPFLTKYSIPFDTMTASTGICE